MERPAGFAEPATAVGLEPAPAKTQPAADPLEPPADFHDQGQPLPLESLRPSQAEQRDPGRPFAIVSSNLTGAAGAVTSAGLGRPRTPDEPFQVVTATPAVTASWAPPPPEAKPAQPVQPVSANDCLAAAYPPLLILMAVIGLVSLVEPLFGVIALVAALILLASRVRFRASALRKTALGVLVVIALLWLLSQVLNHTMYNIDLGLSWWVAIGCWLLALVDVLFQWLGLRRGERPDQGR